MKQVAREFKAEILREKYIQFRFYEQWNRLHRYAKKNGVQIIGDVPIYTSHDSADVWAARHLFKLTKSGSPLKVSGVPPDYFSADGQLWGHPIYSWPQHKKENYRWWISRLRTALQQTDLVRVDHFRGFADYWEVPGRAKTARNGRWRKGPGDSFLKAVKRALGDAPIIAEDLGAKMDLAIRLRDRWSLPGMKVLQFAFNGGTDNPHLPIWHKQNFVVYSGTHDNDTTAGWYKKASAREKELFKEYTGCRGTHAAHHMIRLAYSAVADLAIVPIQDVLGLDSKARTNKPGHLKGNYLWKLKAKQLKKRHAETMSKLVYIYGRDR